jgi:hypothetical protein
MLPDDLCADDNRPDLEEGRDGSGIVGGEELDRRGSSDSAESSLSILVIPDGFVEVLGSEVGPEDVGHIKLGIRGLPQQKVGYAHLAGGANEQVRVGKTIGI